MPAIVLKTSSDDLVGFLLLAGDEDLVTGPSHRGGVLTGVPVKADLLEHPLGSLIQDFKNVEHACRIEAAEQVARISVDISADTWVRIEVVHGREGSWSATRAGEPLPDGVCAILPAKAG